MIFDRMDDQMGGRGNMMDWGSYMWIYMMIGMIIICVIIVIIIYLLNRRKHKEKIPQETKKIAVVKDARAEKTHFCPRCGEKIDDLNLKFCPHCGSEI